jgi:hypothetical protein
MNHSRSYPKVIRRWYRPLEHECAECHRTLREAMTLTRRTVITLDGVIKLNHAGYRCPDAQCPGHQRTYRSPQADALALPYFTFGLDIVLLVGRLRLREHQTVDEMHQELLRRLESLGVKISQREMLYLFEAYGTLMRASSEAKDDQPWLAQVEKNGGIIVSVDGIQEDEGQRDGLSGPRRTHRASALRRKRDLIRDRGDEGLASTGGGVGGESARDDERCSGERTEGGRGTMARGAAPGVSVPRAARRVAERL